MYKKLHELIIKIVFESLITSGTLSYLQINPTLRNEKIIDRKNLKTYLKDTIFSMNDKNSFYTGSYSYLRNIPYKYMNFMDDKNELKNIFDLHQEKSYQHTLISLDWISQLQICHKILNQRINFITGGTGIGKTAVIPFLYMYFLKALEYNHSSRVVCTVPRIKPLGDTSKDMSNFLGVPIKKKENKEKKDDKEKKDNKYDNFYHIQQKSTKHDHITHDDIIFTRLTTDGSLIQELMNPFLKENKGKDYSLRNKFDIIIVDESHEHNTNMDIILTLCRNICHNNNSIKLVIMSATIEDDEPIYRRFYRNINDNKKFPLNLWIKEHKLDRINIDRRSHIAIPGKQTNFEITEIYKPEEEANIVTKNIMNSANSGYGLLFQPGRKEIIESVEYLNQTMKKNIIAIPFYRELSRHLLDIVEDVDNKLKMIKCDRSGITAFNAEWTNGTNTYDQCVIVATPIAEASITIDKLKFVFDTGIQKTSEYNPHTNSSDLNPTFISESSRKQRKGRVGRVSPGKVYFFYKKDFTKNNKIKYSISLQDISFTLIKMLRDSNSEEKCISIDLSQPNNTHKLDDIDKQTKNLNKILKLQYCIDEKIYDYYGNEDYYDYNNYSSCNIFYETGYDSKDIIDSKGLFYVIHPDELKINRNINGEIISKIDETDKDITLIKRFNKLNMISSVKMFSFLNNLMRLFLIGFNKTNIIKTELCSTIVKLHEKLSKNRDFFDYSDTLLIIYSKLFNCYDDILRYISFKNILQNDIKKLFIQDLNTLKTNIITQDSDVYALIEISKKIDNKLKSYGKLYNINDKENVKKIVYDKDKHDKITKILTNKINVNSSKPKEDDMNKYSTNFIEWEEKETNSILKDICDKMHLKFETIQKIRKEYSKLKNTILISENIQEEKSPKNININKIIDKLKPLKNCFVGHDPITICLLLSRPNNIVKFITGTQNKYLFIHKPLINKIASFEYFYDKSNKKFKPMTLMRELHIKNYIYYENYDISKDYIQFAHKIAPKDFKIIINIYNLYVLKKTYDKQLKYRKDMKIDDIKASLNYTKTFEIIYNDLKSNRFPGIWNILSSIDDTYLQFSELMKKYESGEL